MKFPRSSVLVVGALVAGVALAPTMSATAANGKALLLGRSNYASSATTLNRSNGTPLAIKGKTSVPPMTVNSSKTVTHLSADMVDGVSAGSLARTSAKTGTIVYDGTIDGNGAKCPSGTVATGGGGVAEYGMGLIYSGPDWNVDTHAIVANSWLAISDAGVEVSYVKCMSMSGKSIPGAVTRFEQLIPAANVAGVAAPNGRGRDISETAQKKVAQVKEIVGSSK
jgi:hypothetical protein